MVENKINGITHPIGFKANGIHCGIRKNRIKKDLALVYSETKANAASVYTLNKVKGAPIKVCKEHLIDGKAQVMICNSGNANTCNANGVEIANQICELCANELNVDTNDIIIASTGVIGEPLLIEPFANHMHELVSGLDVNKGHDACEAIMTTDTKAKEFASTFVLDGIKCHLGAMVKGSGMIHPNMATMLAFVTSDVAITSSLLKEALLEVVDDTFNMVSVDGDTSTNDMLSIMANGLANNKIIDKKNEAYEIFKHELYLICEEASRQMAKDGEGATKLITCKVEQAPSKKVAKIVSKSVITSSLFKAAMFGKDANWGRILCAIGYCDADFDITLIDVCLQSKQGLIKVCEKGAGCGFDEQQALKILSEDEIDVLINMNQGADKATAWGCDLTYDYVKINGDYRT